MGQLGVNASAERDDITDGRDTGNSGPVLPIDLDVSTLQLNADLLSPEPGSHRPASGRDQEAVHLRRDGTAVRQLGGDLDPVAAQSLDEQARALRDPSMRARLVEAAHHGDYGRAIGAETRKPDYRWIRILDQPVPPNPTVADRAAELGKDPVELMIDMALERDMKFFMMQPVANENQAEALELMKHPRSVVTFSDSGAHVSQIMDASLQTHLLSHWVRDKQAFTLEEAVKMLTCDNATQFGFHDRGLLREGMAADIVVFDPDRRHVISAATHHSAGDINIFEGTEVRGVPEVVIRRGEVIVEGTRAEVVADPRTREVYLGH